MQAIVLVGGEGTRLRPLTLTQPKPALQLVDRPFLRYMVDWLARHDVDDIIFACGFLPDQLREALGDGGEGDPRLRYLTEPEPLGTAGAIKFAAELLDDRFLALNGDVLSDLDLSALIRRHERASARATLALYPVTDPTAYGLVRRREDGEITEFLEKPDPAEIDTDEISAGAYVLEKEVLDLVVPEGNVSIERQVFPRLVGDGLYAERLEGYWMDIGTPERYLAASWDILTGAVETEPGSRADADGVLIADGAGIADLAQIEGPALVQAGAAIAAEARIGPRAVIASGAEVGTGAEIIGSVVLGGAAIGAGAALTGAIVGPETEVGERAVIDTGVVIGAGARISAGTTIESGARIDPEARL